MNDCNQFWWNWWVNLAVALGTFAAVLVALFGDWFRSRFFSPKLKLELRSLTGEKTIASFQMQTEEGPKEVREDARYYHVRVSNGAPWPRATQLQINLLQIEEQGPDGALQVSWAGEVPIRWMHQEIYPLSRTIGPPADSDFFSVVKDKFLQLHPLILPNNLTAIRKGPVHLVVSLQAIANEGKSRITRFQIAWDGQWEDGEKEMTRHLVVKEVTEKA